MVRSRRHLSWSDLASINEQLLRRLRRDGDRQVIAVGLGIKNFHRQPKRRRQSLIFFVSRCIPAKALPARIRMGKQRRVDVFIGRGRNRRRLRLATDVMVLPEARPVVVQTTSNGQSGSAGLIVTWKQGGSSRWALLTAGHSLVGSSLVSDTDEVVISTSDASLNCKRLMVADPSEPFDVGLVRITRVTAEYLAPQLIGVANPTSVPLRDFAAIQANTENHREGGACHSLEGNVAFGVDVAIPGPVTISPHLKPLKYLIHINAANGAGTSPFHPGTSGSPGVEDGGSGLALLVAATSPGFMSGYMQALQPVVDFLASRLRHADLRCVAIL